MINKRILVLFLIGFFSLIGVISLNNACSALTIDDPYGLITGLKSVGIDSDHDDYGECEGGKHDVSFNYNATNCKYGDTNLCGEAVDYFKCFTPGAHCTKNKKLVEKIEVQKEVSESYVKRWKSLGSEEVLKSGHPDDDLYDYYKVVLWVKDGYQNNEGLIYKRKLYNLAGAAYDTAGNRIPAYDPSCKGVVVAGKSASCKRKAGDSNYTFLGWKRYWEDEGKWKYITNTDTSKTYYLTGDGEDKAREKVKVGSMKRNWTFMAVYSKKSPFIGKVDVSGSAWGSTGWTVNGSTSVTINGCPQPGTGEPCRVNFSDEIGGYSPDRAWALKEYRVYRSSNLSSQVAGNSWDNYTNGDQIVVEDNSLPIYPGMELCHSLYFTSTDDPKDTFVSAGWTMFNFAKLCVYAAGDAQPDGGNPDTEENPNTPTGDQSLINIKVRRQRGNSSTNYRRSVYVKPGDVAYFRTNYNPILQYTYGLDNTGIRIDGGESYASNLFDYAIWGTRKRIGYHSSELNMGIGSRRESFGESAWFNGWQNYWLKTEWAKQLDPVCQQYPYAECSMPIWSGDRIDIHRINPLFHTAFDTLKNPDWNNDYVLSGSFNAVYPNYNKTVDNQPGVTNRRSEVLAPGISINNTHVGKKLDETISLNTNDNSSYTPSQINFNHNPGRANYYGFTQETGYDPAKEILTPEDCSKYDDSQFRDQFGAGSSRYGFRNESVEDQKQECERRAVQDISLSHEDKNEVFGHFGGWSGSVTTGVPSRTASVIVPYNFIVTPNDPTLSRNTPYVYSGEEETFGYSIIVETKNNSATNAQYATIVKDAKWRFGLCYNNTIYQGCDKNDYSWTDAGSGDLNDGSDYLTGGQPEVGTNGVIIPDITAGSTICVVLEVSPSDSGADTNYSVDGYNKAWKRSGQSCYVVAKRPTIQTWGGNVFSRGQIDTSVSKKYVKDGDGNTINRVFGSWNELGVIANSVVTGFGSGASMGYAQNPYDATGLMPKTWPRYQYKGDGERTNTYHGKGNLDIGGDPGGSKDSNSCNRIPLTIPNSPCPLTMGVNSVAGITQATNEKQSIINVLGGDNTNLVGDELNRDIVGDLHENNIKAITKKDGDITITSDLIYFDTDSSNLYRTYRDMPKLVIYAKNIRIKCGVERIDALLIAENAVVTCSDNITTSNRLSSKDEIESEVMSTIDNQENSSQLFINGAVIANKMIANRTYGTATGANSIIPAEIINFDPTLYEFGTSAASDDDSTGRLDVTYIREISPRL